MGSNNATVIRKYEEKIEQRTYDKTLLEEKLAKQAEPKGTFEEQLEPALLFLPNPWKLWETPGKAQVPLRRLVLKLTFENGIKYCRRRGARTTEIAFPFKALSAIEGLQLGHGAVEAARTVARTESKFRNTCDGAIRNTRYPAASSRWSRS